MTSFYFGTPFLSKQVAVNWEKSVTMLNSMLASVANQSCKDFHHLIACHEIPPIKNEYKSFVTFIPVNSSIPQNRAEMLADKGYKKQVIGHYLHQRVGSAYLMLLDADDLIHRNLVDYVLENKSPHGYLINQGFMYYFGAKKILPLTRNFDQQCGSCAIFYLTQDELPKTLTDEDNRYSSFKSHRFWGEKAETEGRPLQAIPYPAAIYLRTDDISLSSQIVTQKGFKRLKVLAKRFLIEKPISETIKIDFALETQ
ncbi:hypothetical protein DN062_08405 [Nitrincola tibetensis]|uniref:Glycosyltransferase family 2 protein n=1 Tax=Nitrincola tibetensis TaxID=2219697 RepID=A0A364NMC2_9GAMM|nr:hypothetical protein [Nitrincola tibetensis]RAU18246.1 hypothetical protein DN062_08405 [Nitrincola tibetensis]